MSHGSSTFSRRLFPTITSPSWPVTTNIGRNVRGRAGRLPRVTTPLCLHRSSSIYHKRDRTLPEKPHSRPPPKHTSPPSSSRSPSWPPQQSQPPSHTRNQFSNRKHPSPDDVADDEEFPPWEGDYTIEDPGIPLRRLVRDAGLAFSNSMYPISLAPSAKTLIMKKPKNPAELSVRIQRRQVIHPWSMRFLSQHGHAYEKLTLRRYMEKRKDPLWWFVVLYNEKEFGPGGAYVRSTMKRRVEMAFKLALRARGYDPQGNPVEENVAAGGEGQRKEKRKPIRGSVRFSGPVTKALQKSVAEISEWMLQIVDVLVQELNGRDDKHQGTSPGSSFEWKNKDKRARAKTRPRVV